MSLSATGHEGNDILESAVCAIGPYAKNIFTPTRGAIGYHQNPRAKSRHWSKLVGHAATTAAELKFWSGCGQKSSYLDVYYVGRKNSDDFLLWNPNQAVVNVEELNCSYQHRLAENSRFGWVKIVEVMQNWSSLDDDWFDDHSKKPSLALLDVATKFVSKSLVYIKKVPSPYLDPDGEIGFRWISERGFASVSFDSDGSFFGTVRSHLQGPKLLIDCQFSEWDNYAQFSDLLEDYVI